MKGVEKNMTNSSDAAEQLARIYLEGAEVVIKITGVAAKHIIASLYAISQDKKRTKGKIRLSNMLKTGKELKIFSIKKEDLKMFSKEAKRYGVLYCALINKLKSSPDGMVDIMVRGEDAPKINRIVERFNLSTIVNTAEIKEEIEKNRENNMQEELNLVEKSPEDLLVEDLLSKPEPKLENDEASLSFSRTEIENQLDNYSKNNDIVEDLLKQNEKPSVREELKEIEKELEFSNKQEKAITKEIEHNHIQKKKKQKKKAKHMKNRERSK